MDSKDVEVSNLVPSTSANVHGVFVGALSPVKSSRNNTKMKYFEGQLSDGSKTVRFVSFEPKLRQQIEEAHEKCSSIALRNCAVKRNRQEDLEVLVSSQTKIHSSPKKMAINTASLSLLKVLNTQFFDKLNVLQIKDTSYMHLTPINSPVLPGSTLLPSVHQILFHVYADLAVFWLAFGVHPCSRV